MQFEIRKASNRYAQPHPKATLQNKRFSAKHHKTGVETFWYEDLWFIEINTLEELLEVYDMRIIVDVKDKTITIYDDYVE